MKRFILFTFSILLTFTVAIAQDGINYQGAATDANGDELTNQNITIRASVLSATAKGIYFLEIEMDDGIINKKLILQ